MTSLATATWAILGMALTVPCMAAAPAQLPLGPGQVSASSHDGNVASNTVDGDRKTRWSAKGHGQWIRYDLGSEQTLSFVRIAWHQGNVRSAQFRIEVSRNGSQWHTVHTGRSSGTTNGRETYHFPDTVARHVRIVGNGNSSGNGWNSILETELWGQIDGDPGTPGDPGDPGDPGPDPVAPPGSNFDLSKWKITLPINDAEEHSAAELVNGYTDPRFFFTDPVTGGMVFRAPNIGDTTSGSSYARTELREMLKPTGRANDPANNWVLSSSSDSAKRAAGGVDGTLRAVLTVDRVSTTGEAKKVGRVIVGQIHGPDSEIVRLYYHKLPGNQRGRIYTAHETADGETTTYHALLGGDRNGTSDPADGIALGQLWAYEIKAVGDTLTVTVTPEGRSSVSKRIPIDTGNRGLSQYFKAGAYNQNNTGSSTDYAQVTFHTLTHTHP